MGGRRSEPQESEPSERAKAAMLRCSERFRQAVRRYGGHPGVGPDKLDEATAMAISMEGVRIFDPANPADRFMAGVHGIKL